MPDKSVPPVPDVPVPPPAAYPPSSNVPAPPPPEGHPPGPGITAPPDGRIPVDEVSGRNEEVGASDVDPAEPAAVAPPPPGRGRSRARRILVGGLLVAGLAGVATGGTAGWRIYQQKDARISTPDQITGFRRDDSEQAAATADYLRTALQAAVPLDEVVGAVYRDAADPNRSVLFFGGTSLLWSPERDLDAVLGVVSGEGGRISGEHEVPPGDLGGVMKCGSADTAEGAIAVCGWADHGSVGVAMFPDRKPAESAPLLRQFRETTQNRD